MYDLSDLFWALHRRVDVTHVSVLLGMQRTLILPIFC